MELLLHKLGFAVLRFTRYIGGLTLLSVKALQSLWKDKFNFKDTIDQIELVGIRSSSLTNLVAIFTGMVLAVQFIVGLERFGLQLYTGRIIGVSIFRELGPVLTSIMIAARVGSGIAAELGSMNVTEQILAIEAMGASPVQKLVVPRVIATALCAPVLTVFANLIGVFGGMLITMMETGVGAHFYFDQIIHTVNMSDFVSGVCKTFFFGLFIGMISCYEGLKTYGGTAGVGAATTKSVVFSSISIFISDFFLTKLFLVF